MTEKNSTATITITHKDVATVDVLHDVFAETYSSSFDTAALKNARKLAKRMTDAFTNTHKLSGCATEETISNICASIDELSLKEQERAEEARIWNRKMHAKLDSMIHVAQETLKERGKTIEEINKTTNNK